METSNSINLVTNHINVEPNTNQIEQNTDNKDTRPTEIQQLLLYRVRDNRNNYIIVSKSNTLDVQKLFKGKLVINLGTLVPDDNHKVDSNLATMFKDTDYIRINKINTGVSNSSLQTLLVSLLTGKSKYKFVQVGDAKSNTYVLKQ